jgi:hypothetical protein
MPNSRGGPETERPAALPYNSLHSWKGDRVNISAEEIKEFWRGYCERRDISPDIVAKGEKKIEEDPERWADETMDSLLREIAN